MDEMSKHQILRHSNANLRRERVFDLQGRAVNRKESELDLHSLVILWSFNRSPPSSSLDGSCHGDNTK